MTKPMLDIIAAALPGDSEIAKLEVAREVLARLRDHDRDPDTLFVRLETCDAERAAVRAIADSSASQHITSLTELALARDELAIAARLAESRAGAVRILKIALDGGPLDADAARAIVEGDPDATQG